MKLQNITKTNSQLILVCIILLTFGLGCKQIRNIYNPPPRPISKSTPQDTGKLTREKAQATIDRFVSGNGKGRITIKGGVREVPAQNAAVVDINMDDYIDNKHGQKRGKPATATFSRYNDGRWSLTVVLMRLPRSYGSIKWTMNIEVQ